ncbi:ubiquitin carboxyl-terminal hydrolase MINDY-2-like [Anneissia japonica]|uniref:ubiquitin carboxyl-terminal hydrolase MINDY-2-like n=1 Tax=Anneissia japonica TaxID=1529436 RepID=UPI001425AEB3|nr:ubiquitin carboxyl-terminal hydrolase MINDY-2-like [Anneissia japonica]
MSDAVVVTNDATSKSPTGPDQQKDLNPSCKDESTLESTEHKDMEARTGVDTPPEQDEIQEGEKESAILDNICEKNVEGTVVSKPVENSALSDSAATPAVSLYHIKWIKWHNQKTPIITQNENGPCPLIAIMNVLILRGKVKLQDSAELITAHQLMEYLGNCILEYVPKDASNDMQRNYEQNMDDAMAILPKLQTGLDVNVKFTGVQDFEYTSECIVFDLLNITLCHGWLYDPQNPEVVSAVGTHSYNQLVEKIINGKSSGDPQILQSALVAEQFLESTAAQLTYHGLCEINSTIKDDNPCVFFRNNHFSTLLKHENQLYHLVTDQGFLRESNVVWETLTNVEGDCNFLNADFNTRSPSMPDSPPMTQDQQISNDLLIALSLQENDQGCQEDPPEAPVEQAPVPLSDHELALQLQQEEDRLAAEAAARNQDAADGQPQQQPQQPTQQQAQQPSSPRRRECIIV